MHVQHVHFAQARPPMSCIPLVIMSAVLEYCSLLKVISIGNHTDFECNLGIIARATGKVIARAIASAIYDCCECNYSQME